MKKQILLLAGSALILASCGSNNNNQANEQAKIDSITKANAALQDQMNKAKNDSTINAMAKIKADSIELANKAAAKPEASAKHHEHKAKEPVAAPTPAPPPPPVKTAQDNKFDSRQPGNQSKPTLTPEQQKAQEDKFNRRGGK